MKLPEFGLRRAGGLADAQGDDRALPDPHDFPGRARHDRAGAGGGRRGRAAARPMARRTRARPPSEPPAGRTRWRIARAHGYAHVIDYRPATSSPAVQRDTPPARGCTSSTTASGATPGAGRSPACARRGMFVSFGQSSGVIEGFALSDLAAAAARCRPAGRACSTTSPTAPSSRSGRATSSRCVATGAIRAEVGQRFPLAEAAEAHRALAGRRTRGATVLYPDRQGYSVVRKGATICPCKSPNGRLPALLNPRLSESQVDTSQVYGSLTGRRPNAGIGRTKREPRTSCLHDRIHPGRRIDRRPRVRHRRRLDARLSRLQPRRIGRPRGRHRADAPG